VGHAAGDFHAGTGYLAKFEGVVGLGVYSGGEVFADLILVYIEGGNEFYIADMIAAQVYVH
jgi:hypothetical protein